MLTTLRLGSPDTGPGWSSSNQLHPGLPWALTCAVKGRCILMICLETAETMRWGTPTADAAEEGSFPHRLWVEDTEYPCLGLSPPSRPVPPPGEAGSAPNCRHTIFISSSPAAPHLLNDFLFVLFLFSYRQWCLWTKGLQALHKGSTLLAQSETMKSGIGVGLGSSDTDLGWQQML